MLGELKRRFDKKNIEIMKAIQSCNPQSVDFLNYERLLPLAIQYGVDVNLLKNECQLAKHTFRDREIEAISEYLKEVSAFSSIKEIDTNCTYNCCKHSLM